MGEPRVLLLGGGQEGRRPAVNEWHTALVEDAETYSERLESRRVAGCGDRGARLEPSSIREDDPGVNLR